MSAPVVWHWEALASAPLPAGLTVTAAVVLAGTPLSPNVAFVLAAPTSPVLAALAGCGPGGCQNATLVTLTGTGFGQAAPRDEPLGGGGGSNCCLWFMFHFALPRLQLRAIVQSRTDPQWVVFFC